MINLNTLENIRFDVPENLLDRFYIVLVNPKLPKNVGSSARAMLNMGFHNLIIVGSEEILTGEAYATARTAEEVLKNALFVSTLKEGLNDMNYIIGTTRRPSRYEYNIITSDQIGPALIARAQNNKIAILFGPEDTGLHMEHITFCNDLIRIPTSGEYPSMNLSQAVLIICYEIFKNIATSDIIREGKKTECTSSVVEGLFEHLEQFLMDIDYFSSDDRGHSMQLFRQIFRRSTLNDYDIGLLRSILHKTQYFINKKIKNP